MPNSHPTKPTGGHTVHPRGEIIPPIRKPRKPKVNPSVLFAVKQWVRIRGPRARKHHGAEFIILQDLEKWLKEAEP